MKLQLLTALSSLVVATFATPLCAQNLLRNPSFEGVPSSATGQGLLPSDWFDYADLVPGADTYSTDGSYGWSPGTSSQFVGATPADGIRFVAGARFNTDGFEGLRQSLSAPLAAGQQYYFRASLRKTTRTSDAASGGYDVLLSSSSSVGASAVLVGTLSEATSDSVWQERSISFVAPTNASTLTNFIVRPYTSQPGFTAYIGIDRLLLTMLTNGPAVLEIYPAAELSWFAETNKTYQLQYSIDVGATSWTSLGSPQPGNGQTNSFCDRTTSPRRFYRVLTLGQ